MASSCYSALCFLQKCWLHTSRPVPKVERSLGCAQSRQPKEERPGMDRVELETGFTALVSSMQAWSAASTPRSLRTFLCPCDSSRTPQMQTHQAQHRFVCFLKKPKLFCPTAFPCFILMRGSKLFNVLYTRVILTRLTACLSFSMIL